MTAGDKVVVVAVVPAGDALATAELVPAIRRTAAAEVGVPAVDRRGAAGAVRAGDEVLVESRVVRNYTRLVYAPQWVMSGGLRRPARTGCIHTQGLRSHNTIQATPIPPPVT